MMPAVLIIDADPAARRALRAAFSVEGYRSWEAETATAGLAEFAARAPQAVLIDLDLPHRAGFEALASIRDSSAVPLLALSAKLGGPEQVEALDAGANDFIIKPFREAELLARLRVALRVSARSSARQEVLTVGALRLETPQGRVFFREREIALTPTEFKLLEVMARDAGRVVTHRRLLVSVWGVEYLADVQYLRVFMSRLRGKLKAGPDAPPMLLTQPRVGYRLRATA